MNSAKQILAPWGVHWFRRDLRIAGNAALRANWKRTEGRTLGLFCFDSKFLARPDFSHNRFAFFLKTLSALRSEFRAMGGNLLVVDEQPTDFFDRLLTTQSETLRPQVVSWNRDYEPFARARDEKVQKLLQKNGLEVLTTRDHLLFEPDEIFKTQPGSFYQVYSPFGRKWFEALNGKVGQARLAEQAVVKRYEVNDSPSDLFRLTWADVLPDANFTRDEFDRFDRENRKSVTISIPAAGFREAYQQLKQFKDKLEAYKEDRDRPDMEGTSRLSHFLKNGSLTSSQILHHLVNSPLTWDKPSGRNQFVKEIAWREFYYHILYHRPDVESGAFLADFRDLAWENREDYFARWKEGSTGFPIVDAGMRELRKTGWMHNRVRMIVSSFLTKDLLIDWRWGEAHFMHLLLDGDLAPNNGGWQWAASTGCDPQPYFRIFNPWLQSEKFDPEGKYIRQYVPELREAPTAALHDPEADRSRWKYPEPIVDHKAQKVKALALYKRNSK
ncbi:MAG: deoxyribodipyrimidine photo-lyase [Bdellovibrionales bacterium]